MRKSNWVYLDGGWRHRPWWKVAINTVLRAIQRGRKYRWLIASKASGGDSPDVEPVLIDYYLVKVEMLDAA